MICALLILQEPELPLPLDTLAPWINMVTRARTGRVRGPGSPGAPPVHRDPHAARRDTRDPAVTYICAGRDPRNGRLSMDRHIGNTGIGAFLSQRERAAAIDGTELGPLRPPRPRRGGERDRYWQRADDETPPAQAGSSLRRTTGPGDVPGHRRRSRRRVCALQRPQGRPGGADAADGRAPRHRRQRARQPRLVQAATFESMASKAGTTVPGGGPKRWIDPAAFFSRGTSGQCRGLLDNAGLARYAARVRALASATSSSGCTQADRLQIPVRRYARTTRSRGQRRPPPVTAGPRSGPASGDCTSTDTELGVMRD